MTFRSPIFAALAAIYEESQAGRTGRGERDVQPTFGELDDKVFEQTKQRLEGDSHELALAELGALDGRVLTLEWDHPRARTTLHKVRLAPRNEAAFYERIGRESPTQVRTRWSDLFREAADWPAALAFAAEWRSFCAARAEQAIHWKAMKPFRMRSFREGRPLLEITLRLLGWQSPPGGTLIRWVSSFLCGKSKTLETAQASRESLLREASGGRIADFESHGILPMPREARLSGPLRLRLRGAVFDCGVQEVSTLSLADLQHAEFLDCSATRCLTVENKTVFLDLVHKRSGELIVWTSFPTAPTLALLTLLPSTLEFHHFGDTDPSGFHILDDLRRRSGLPFHPFRMRFRAGAITRPLSSIENELLRTLLGSPHLAESRAELIALLDQQHVGAFEQEDHQPAPLARWPFYPDG